MKKGKKILYFIKGAVPKKEDVEAAEKLSGDVVFRNALFIANSTCVEDFDAVAGAVPEAYLKAEAQKKADAEAKAKAEKLAEEQSKPKANGKSAAPFPSTK